MTPTRAFWLLGILIAMAALYTAAAWVELARESFR